MNHPKLYSKDSLGNTRVWWIERDEDKYRQNYGQLDGKIVTTGWTEVEAKNIGKANELNSLEQCKKEIKALYVKQEKTGYHKNIEDIDKVTFVEPMLAKNFKDRKDKIKYPVGLQCKYNGGRCVATKDGLFTRKGERYISVPHIEDSLKSFFKKWPDAVLDGELLGDGFKASLNETMKLIRKSVHITEEDLAKSEKLVKYWVYDAYDFAGVDKDTPYLYRREAIEDNLKGNPYYKSVPTAICNDEGQVFRLFGKLIEDGEEGAIIRLLNEPYQNKRSASLLKLKPEDDDEAIILDITEGSGDWAKTGKRITLRWKDRVFDATFKGTWEDAKQFLIDKNKYIGKQVTFLYNGLTGLGVPNYARVDFNNCFKS